MLPHMVRTAKNVVHFISWPRLFLSLFVPNVPLPWMIYGLIVGGVGGVECSKCRLQGRHAFSMFITGY